MGQGHEKVWPSTGNKPSTGMELKKGEEEVKRVTGDGQKDDLVLSHWQLEQVLKLLRLS